MKISYNSKKKTTKITLSDLETRQFLNSQGAVEFVRKGIVETKELLVSPTIKPSARQIGEHLFSNPTNGIPRCITCGCDEDDAFVGGQECSYGQKPDWKVE